MEVEKCGAKNEQRGKKKKREKKGWQRRKGTYRTRCSVVVLLALAGKRLEEEKAWPTGEARDVWVPAVSFLPNRNTYDRDPKEKERERSEGKRAKERGNFAPMQNFYSLLFSIFISLFF